MNDCLDFLVNHALVPFALGCCIALLWEFAMHYERRPWHIKRTSRYESPLWRYDD